MAPLATALRMAVCRDAGLDPVSWTSSERWLRCPAWIPLHPRAERGGASRLSSRPSLVLDRGKGIESGARELNLVTSALGKWVKHARADRTQRPQGLTTAEREELARLRKENRILEEERDIEKSWRRLGHDSRVTGERSRLQLRTAVSRRERINSTRKCGGSGPSRPSALGSSRSAVACGQPFARSVVGGHE